METRDAMLLRLPTALKEKLEQAAKDHRRSANMEAQVAIETHLAPQQKTR